MPRGWEGNRRSGVALATRHRLQWFIHLRAHGLRKGDEHPAYTPRGVWHLYFFKKGKALLISSFALAGPCLWAVSVGLSAYCSGQ